ncbi:hypothetical protein K2173_014746 [Erythroxylum novogranatense]|uniref:Uncharacterized protein n=1 Tax=Erythroxylum novogranatense TaxID=1862640 RepID=A0AAV8THE0_9ROSI|nr:hypothetical protein K2173_014746 [Erythroxylum novogranatense]
MFPWLAFGHMIPYLELAKLRAQKGHKITFFSTPRNIDRLPKIPSDLVPPEATTDVPYNIILYLKLALDGLKEQVSKFLGTLSPDWVLYDFTHYWMPEIATSLDISKAFFSIYLAAMISVVKPPNEPKNRTKAEDYMVPTKWVPLETTTVFRLLEIRRIMDVRTRMVEELHGKPFIPVGVLLTTECNDGEEETRTWRSMKEGLDKQEKGSVVYVAFGSEAKPSQEELTETALGLELSGFAFFWVLRKRRGLADPEVIELPEAFEERTKERGAVYTSWAPQLKILAHDSIGGFLTHSGWSSVVEALEHERPLILRTYLADQGINARVLEEKKMGYLIPRNEIDRSFIRDTVAELVRLVMLEKEGKYREKIKEMKDLLCDS